MKDSIIGLILLRRPYQWLAEQRRFDGPADNPHGQNNAEKQDDRQSHDLAMIDNGVTPGCRQSVLVNMKAGRSLLLLNGSNASDILTQFEEEPESIGYTLSATGQGLL